MYTDKDWNDRAVKEVEEGATEPFPAVYPASKVLSERAAWKAELDETQAKLEKAEDEKRFVKEDLQRCEQRLKSTEEALKSLEEEHRLYAPRLTAVQEAMRVLEEEHWGCAVRLKTAEEVMKLLEEREVSLKAQLRRQRNRNSRMMWYARYSQYHIEFNHLQTLDNPITIAGGLSGANDDIDDKCWKVPTLPFAVSIYGHSSRELLVADNGTISFYEAVGKPRDLRNA